MKVSILMSVLNGQKTLDRALYSIKAQTFKVDEVVIINDGSTDNTAKILNEWAKDLPINLIVNKENNGLAYSLGLGMSATSAEWIFRLDADDYWAPNHVENLLSLIESNPGAVIVSSAAIYVDEGMLPIGKSKKINNQNARTFLMWDNPFIHSAVAINKQAYFSVGEYRNVMWEDYDLWIRLLSSGDLLSSSYPSCFHSISTNSLSRIDYKTAIKKRWNLQKKAIKKFSYTNPFLAILIYVLGFLRILWLKIKK